MAFITLGGETTPGDKVRTGSMRFVPETLKRCREQVWDKERLRASAHRGAEASAATLMRSMSGLIADWRRRPNRDLRWGGARRMNGCHEIVFSFSESSPT